MRNAFAVFLFCGMALLSGCAFGDLLAGIERDDDGKVIRVSGGIADAGFSIVDALLGGGIATGVGGAALKWYRHKRIVASGGKDDDNDGVPDPEKKAV